MELSKKNAPHLERGVPKALDRGSSHNTITQMFYTRREVATLFSCSLSTVYNWTCRGILKSYGIGNRVLYKVDEVHNAIVEL
jgi:excisionase family DNA binding protein